ncbi:MAG: hypothetical protein DRZ76_03725 [Candidatus Nealsonbacteria bacterium]|nr:MAG: hypothetical protein DRZ76_03725 [Candidatus Nealsonbacteria bacterium]
MVIFTSWITVNLFLYFMTHQKTGQGIATVFNQPWNEVSCNYATEPCATAFCGDEIVQRPNVGGVKEECETGERWEGFKARKNVGEAVDIDNNRAVDQHDYFALVCSCDEDCYSTADVSSCCGNGRWEAGEGCDPTVSEKDWLASGYAEDYSGDGNIDSIDYNLMKHVCTEECRLGCLPSDPHFADINKGCYTPEGSSDPCQKGVWACDTNTGKVKCLDVYSTETVRYEDYYIGGELYDYCCKDGGNALTGMSFQIVRGPSGNFRCDNVCRKLGKICVGVGLRDVSMTHCTYITHNIGNKCQRTGNLTSANCRFSFTGGSGFCRETTASPIWSMERGETACYCK